ETIAQIDKDIANAEEEITDKRDKLYGIDQRLQTANEIFQLERTVQELVTKQTERTKRIETYEKEIVDLQRAEARYDTDIDRLQDEIDDNRQDMRLIQDHELYKEVKNT